MTVTDRGFDVSVEDGIPVELPSGAMFYVLTQDEADYLNERVNRYLSDNHFKNVSDFQDVDKMVVFELFVHRWSMWLSKGRDYYNDEINAKQLADTINSYSTELRLLKKNLGIDKPARDRQRGDDSIPAYLDALRQRALEFGYHRNDQANHVMEAFQRLSAMITYHDNCFAADESVITLDGTFTFAQLAGTTPTLLMRDGSWKSAPVCQFGEQELWEITMVRGRTERTVRATSDHRWYARKRTGGALTEVLTRDLVGWRIPSICSRRQDVDPSPWGIAHGITFGDGSRDGTQPGSPSHVVLCGEKDAQLLKWFPHSPTREIPGIGVKVLGLPRSWKDAPSLSMDLSYLAGWLAGYLAADGSVSDNGSVTLYSANPGHLRVAEDVCYRLGIPTLGITASKRMGFGGESELHRLRFPVVAVPEKYVLMDTHRRNLAPRLSGRQMLGDWRVQEVRSTGEIEPVYCAQVEGLKSFVLAGNLLTGNCTEEERLEFGVTIEDCFDVLRDEVKAWDALDEKFRTTKQAYWIRKQ